MAETDQLTQAVLRKHPQYQRMERIYRFFEESYKGGSEYVGAKNLFKHTFEDQEGFTERKERAYYYNYCAPIVNAYNSFIYRQKIQRDYGALADDELFQLFLDDADKQGNSYDEMVRNSSNWASVTGIRYWLIDKPEEKADTKKDEIENELYPYIVHLSPLDVLDWGLDKYGRLLWVKVREGTGDSEDFKAETEEVERYRVWYRDRWELYEIHKEANERKAVLKDEGEHPVGEVPIVQVVHFSEQPMTGGSLLNDIAYVNRAIYNWCSLLDEILYRQTFSQLVMPEDPKNPISSQALGTARGLGFPPDARHAPHFISPDASQAEVLMDQIERAVEEIYRLATLSGGSGVEKDASGVSKAYDFTITNNTLSSKAINMADAETRALKIWAKWQGVDDPGISIEYPREFDVIALSEEIENLIKIQTLNISKKFESIIKNRIVGRMAPRLSEEDRKQIEAEIEQSASNTQQSRFGNQTDQIFGQTGTEGGE